jgi:hypothetical protein
MVRRGFFSIFEKLGKHVAALRPQILSKPPPVVRAGSSFDDTIQHRDREDRFEVPLHFLSRPLIRTLGPSGSGLDHRYACEVDECLK